MEFMVNTCLDDIYSDDTCNIELDECLEDVALPLSSVDHVAGS
jgi:hypothetical protein